jgi:hypothetical protein
MENENSAAGNRIVIIPGNDFLILFINKVVNLTWTGLLSRGKFHPADKKIIEIIYNI